MTPNPDKKRSSGPPNTDSVFFSIAPQPSVLRPEGRPAAVPSGTPDQVMALKARLDSLERNLSALAEKKPETPVAAAEPLTALKARLDSLENNISALVEKKLAVPAVAAKQLTALGNRLDSLEKSIIALVEKASRRDAAVSAASERREQSLLSALSGLADRLDNFNTQGTARTGELEKYSLTVKDAAAELLASFSERGKSSELDQRVRDQLEKSWARVQELEKKLEESYKISMEARLKGKEEKKAETEALAEFGRKTAALEDRFSELRGFIDASRAKDNAILNEGAARFYRRADGLEEKISGLSNSMEFLRQKEEETVKQISGVGAGVDSIAEILVRLDPEKYEAHSKDLRGELAEIRQAFKEQSDHFWEKFLDFNLIAENFRTESKALGAGLEKVVVGNERLLAVALDNIGAIIDKALRSFLAELQDKNRKQFAELSANYDSALETLRRVGSVCSSIEHVSKRLEGYESTLKTFVAQVGCDQLTSISGVSGIVVRENFGAITAMAAELKREREYLDAASKDISDKTSRVIKGDAGAAEMS